MLTIYVLYCLVLKQFPMHLRYFSCRGLYTEFELVKVRAHTEFELVEAFDLYVNYS